MAEAAVEEGEGAEEGGNNCCTMKEWVAPSDLDTLQLPPLIKDPSTIDVR